MNNVEQVYFWDELLYLAVLPVTKISILLFYLKIFPKKQVRIAIWVLIGFNAAYLVVFEVISIFQCTPVQGAWLAWDGTFEATCRDINMQGWAAAGLNVVLDLAVLILPLPELAALSLSLRKKVQILSMFCVGFLYVPTPLCLCYNAHWFLLTARPVIVSPLSVSFGFRVWQNTPTLKTSRVSRPVARLFFSP